MKKNRVRRLLLMTLWLSGAALMIDAGYIHAKAWLGQRLLDSAWQSTQKTQQSTKPWWWADTFPVAALSAPRHQERFLILHGANGEALAWGPGWLSSSTPPGEIGNSVIAAHRDTHFRFLQDIQRGDQLIIENRQQQQTVYEVVRTRIVDVRHLDSVDMPFSDHQKLLTLVTCYPFNALATGNHQRFIVEAQAVH